MPTTSPQQHLMRSGVDILLNGHDGRKQWLSQSNETYPVSHVESFQTQYSTMSRSYRDYDEAMINSRDNARYMLNDIGIRECLDSRQRSVALLNWHLKPEEETSLDQQEFCKLLEKVIRRIRRFYEYRRGVQEAIWYGKYGMKHRWRATVVGGQSIWMPTGRHQDDNGWQPLHGDKIVFRSQRIASEPNSYEGQMGIRVGWMNHKPGDIINRRWKVEGTDYGPAYFLSPAERRSMLVHKHDIKDAAYEDAIRAGSIHGVGIRSVVYLEWLQKQETMAFMMDFLERMAGGIQIWKYPQGNKQALAEIREAAENYNSGKEHALLVPVPVGESAAQYGVEVSEPGFQGIETIQHLIKEYFNDRVKRYILGQKLSSEAEATGLGSGVAEIHMDTLLQIIKADATNHEETMSEELVAEIVRINVERKVWSDPGFLPRFVVETEESDVEKKLEGVVTLMREGIKFRKKDLYELVSMAQPQEGDEVNPDPPQQQSGPAAGGMLPMKPEKSLGTDNPHQPDANPRDDMAADRSVSKDHVQRYSSSV